MVSALGMPQKKIRAVLTLCKSYISTQKTILVLKDNKNRFALNCVRNYSVNIPSWEHNSLTLLAINSCAPSYFLQTSSIIFLYILFLLCEFILPAGNNINDLYNVKCMLA